MKKIIKSLYNHRELIFQIGIILLIIIFAFSLAPKRLQNDTFYTIPIGKLISENGIDLKEHFSWHEGLPYTYPHWLYDLLMYKIYDISGFDGIYASTCILAAILGIAIYKVNSKLTKNKIISLLITIGSLYLLKGYIAARAQLVTFILLILILYNIEKFIETGHKTNALALILIPILIANLHAATWPFIFILYLPYIAEYIISVIADIIIKQKREDRKDNKYKLEITRNKNVLMLVLIMFIVLFTGLLTPIGDTPYTYTLLTMKGNTMENINEHLPLTLIKNTPIMITIIVFIAILTFTKVKIRLSDLFMLGGLMFLMFSSRRQSSMYVLICGVILAKLIIQLPSIYNLKIKNKQITKYINKYTIFIVIACFTLLLSLNFYNNKNNEKYISNVKYPVQAAEWMLKNLDVKNIKLYNEYNYGSYLLFKGIPVFIDSRADVYDPVFDARSEEDIRNLFKESKKEGKDIFGDFIGTSNISKYYGTTFERYGITHALITRNSKTAMLIRKADSEKYEELYSDDNFVLYKVIDY